MTSFERLYAICFSGMWASTVEYPSERFLSCAAILIWGSVFFAFVFISGYEDSFIYLGGQHGYYISEVLVANVGIPGTILVLLGSFMVIAVFMSPKTIPFLQGLFSFGWLERFKRQPGEKPDKVEEPVEEEPREFRPADEEERLFDTEAELEKAEEELAQERRPEPANRVAEPESWRPEPEVERPAVEEQTQATDEGFEVTVAKEEEYVPEKVDENGLVVEVPVGDEEYYDESAQGDYDPKLDLSSFKNGENGKRH